MPTLKFFVQGKNANDIWTENALVLPQKDLTLDANEPLIFIWKALENAAAYRLEISDNTKNPMLSALLVSPVRMLSCAFLVLGKIRRKRLKLACRGAGRKRKNNRSNRDAENFGSKII